MIHVKPALDEWLSVNKAFGLVLPDGWFGRPFDNLHALTYMEVRPHKVLIELDELILLVFTELQTVNTVKNEMALGDFDHLVFDWQEYGSLISHVSTYKTGEVRFVAPS